MIFRSRSSDHRPILHRKPTCDSSLPPSMFRHSPPTRNNGEKNLPAVIATDDLVRQHSCKLTDILVTGSDQNSVGADFDISIPTHYISVMPPQERKRDVSHLQRHRFLSSVRESRLCIFSDMTEVRKLETQLFPFKKHMRARRVEQDQP